MERKTFLVVMRWYGNLGVGSIFGFFQPETAVLFKKNVNIFFFFWSEVGRKLFFFKPVFAPIKQNTIY